MPGQTSMQPHRQKVVPDQTSMYVMFLRRNCFANLDILHGELEGGYPQVQASGGASLHHLLTRRQEGVESLYKNKRALLFIIVKIYGTRPLISGD